RSSPSTISTSSPSRFARNPVEKLSSTRTSSPRSTRARTRLEPMKPAPPVTSTFAIREAIIGTGLSLSPNVGSGRDAEPEREPGQRIGRDPGDRAERVPDADADEHPERGEQRDLRRAAPRSSRGEREPADEDGDEEHEPDDAGLGERLDVEVLDAPRVLRRRKSAGRRARELLACVGEVRRVDGVLERALEARTDRRVVEEDPPADVDQQRPLDERLDVPLLLLRADPEVAQEMSDVAAAQGDEAGDDDERQAEDRGQPPPRSGAAPATGGDRGRGGQAEADRAGGGAGEDQADHARERSGGGEPPPTPAREG